MALARGGGGRYTVAMADMGFAVLIIVGILCAPVSAGDTLKTKLAALGRTFEAMRAGGGSRRS